MKRRAAVILVSSGCLSCLALAALLAGCSSSEAPSQPALRKATAISEAETPIVATDVLESESTKSQTAEATPVANQPQPEKKKREPIYNEQADARADIQAALQRAAYDNKRVLVKFGGNWCGWCFKLHDLFRENKEIAATIRVEYELVLVDVNTNRELLEEYDPNGKHGFPWLTVLDASGNVLCNQDTGSLEEGPKHDPQKVQDFLGKWQPTPLDAEQTLTAAKDRARTENKRVLVHIGAPWCGWCHVLDRFLREQHDLIGVDYIDLKIDQDRMEGGKEVATRLRAGSTSGGIPWFVILDADGKPLATSDGPRGNIGYPSEPHEIEYFVAMLNRTKQHLSDEQVATLERQLVDNAAKRKAAAH